MLFLLSVNMIVYKFSGSQALGKGAVGTLYTLAPCLTPDMLRIGAPRAPLSTKSNPLYAAIGYNTPRGANAPEKVAPHPLESPNLLRGDVKAPRGKREGKGCRRHPRGWGAPPEHGTKKKQGCRRHSVYPCFFLRAVLRKGGGLPSRTSATSKGGTRKARGASTAGERPDPFARRTDKVREQARACRVAVANEQAFLQMGGFIPPILKNAPMRM